jgi:hypothetical protein
MCSACPARYAVTASQEDTMLARPEKRSRMPAPTLRLIEKRPNPQH